MIKEIVNRRILEEYSEKSVKAGFFKLDKLNK